MFVSHDEIAQWCLEHEFMPRMEAVAKAHALPLPDRKVFLQTSFDTLASETLETVQRLAKDRPVLRVHIRQNGAFSVEEKGIVGKP